MEKIIIGDFEHEKKNEKRKENVKYRYINSVSASGWILRGTSVLLSYKHPIDPAILSSLKRSLSPATFKFTETYGTRSY